MGALEATGREGEGLRQEVIEQRKITATWATMPWAYCGSAGFAVLNWKGRHRGQLL